MDKKNNTTINPVNKKDNKCFQYAVTVALNHEEIGKHSERITKIKPFINKYNWEETNFSSEKDDWKKIEKNNEKIALNVLHAKRLSALVRGITYKHHGDFYCLKCLHSFAKKTNVNLIKTYVKIKIFVTL